MKKTNVKVYTEFDNKYESNSFFAIKDNDVIKYIDLENNKIIVDMKNNTIIKENNDYLFNIDFINKRIDIKIKKLMKFFTKEIKLIKLEKTNKSFLVRYLLIDDNIYNEYYIVY